MGKHDTSARQAILDVILDWMRADHVESAAAGIEPTGRALRG